jgi:hypothetical protein
MNDFATHVIGFAAIQNRLGADCPVVTWDDLDFKVIPGSTRRRRDLGPGGFNLNSDFQFEALVSTFANGLTITDAHTLKDQLLQTRLGYLGDEYKPIAVTVRPGGLHVLVECNSLSQG